MHDLVAAFLSGYALLIWLNTNAFAEYVGLLRLHSILPVRVDEFLRLQEDGYTGSYVEFLVEIYRHMFIVRLVSCPICLSTWFGIVYGCIHRSFEAGGVHAALTLLSYLLFTKML